MSDPAVKQDPWSKYAEQPASGDKWAQYAQKTETAPSPEPGLLDKEIPLDTPLHATEAGLQSIGRGVRSAIKGTFDTFRPAEGVGENALQALGPGVLPAVRVGKGLIGLGKEATQVPAAIHDINASADPTGTYLKAAGETAGEGAGQALTALATEGAIRAGGSVPKEVATAPVRVISRGTEGVINSSPLRYVRGAARMFEPADTARKMIKVPGRDFGLTLPEFPGAPLPERPLPALMQARGLQTGAQAAQNPSEALARIPVHPSEAISPVRPPGKLGGRYVLMPEEVQQAEQIQRIAKQRASQRGMQYAAGMRPSGGKIAAP